MKTFIVIIGVLCLFTFMASLSYAGTWFDNFSGEELDQSWKGDRDNFLVFEDMLYGRNANPILLLPLKMIEVGDNWDDYTVECRINVFTENLLVCTKGAIVLRRKDNEGYVFALHVATKTVEVFRLSDGEMLISESKPIELQKWYLVRAELNGENMSFYLDNELIGKITDNRSTSGSVGLAVQDALAVQYDDFTVTGPKVEGHGVTAVKTYGKVSTTWASPKSMLK